MRSSDGLPTIAIVGRPNVGKSTLFNRILGRKRAVVHDEAGVTRDRNYARAAWGERDFWLIDTGGVTLWDGHGIELEVQEQVEIAIEEADLVLFLLDARVGLSAEDEEVAQRLLRTGKPVVVVANKADNERLDAEALSVVAGGLGGAAPVSALTGRNLEAIMDAVLAELPPAATVPDFEDHVRVAIIGRPNVGKSSLVNALVGEKKMIVAAEAGTTRDSVDTPLEVDGTKYLLVDTAGLRRKSRIMDGIEFWSSLRSARAVRQSDVAVVVMDATQGISEQDVKIAAESVEQGASVILCVNKWDAIEKDHDTARKFEDRVKWHFKFLPDAPLVYCSALTGRKIGRILPESARLAGIRQRRIPTAQVNEVLRKLVESHPPPSARSTKLTRVLYGTQVSNRPPTFAVFTNRPENLEGHYARFLRNAFKEEFGFEGTPVKIVVRKREAGEEEG